MVLIILILYGKQIMIWLIVPLDKYNTFHLQIQCENNAQCRNSVMDDCLPNLLLNDNAYVPVTWDIHLTLIAPPSGDDIGKYFSPLCSSGWIYLWSVSHITSVSFPVLSPIKQKPIFDLCVGIDETFRTLAFSVRR